MEREQIGERVRDNMFLLARSGRWLGGSTPLGFHVKGKALWRRKDPESLLSGSGRKRSRNPPPDLPGVFKLPFFYQNSSKAHGEKNIYKERESLYSGDHWERFWKIRYTARAGSWPMIILLLWAAVLGISREEASEEKGLIRYGKTVSSRYRGQETPPQEWIIAQGEHRGLIFQEDFLRVQSLLERHRLGKAGRGAGSRMRPVCWPASCSVPAAAG